METAPAQSSPWWPIARFVLGGGSAIALGAAAVFLVFFGLVVFTGCFWACNQSDPQPFFGDVIFAGAAAAAGGAVTALAAAVAGQRAPLRAIWAGSSVVAAIALLISFANG